MKLKDEFSDWYRTATGITLEEARRKKVADLKIIQAAFMAGRRSGGIAGNGAVPLSVMEYWERIVTDEIIDLREARRELDELIQFLTGEVDSLESENGPKTKTLPFRIGDFVTFIANTITQFGMIEKVDTSSKQVIVVCNERRFVVPVEEISRPKNGT